MARVPLANQPWGWVADASGNGLANKTVSLTTLNGTAATHYSALVGGTSSTSTFTTNSDGTMPRYIDEGLYLLTVDGSAKGLVMAGSGRGGSANVTMYVSPSGSDTNDGLTSGAPKTLQGAFDTLLDYGPSLAGTWTISLAAGTYSSGPYSLANGVLSPNRITIKGPDVGGHPNVPTAIINAAGAGNGLILGTDTRLQVQDIKVINASVTDSSTAAGFLANTGADVYWKNCHAAGNGAYAGIYNSACSRVRLEGGRFSGTQQYPTVYYNCNPGTHGYNSVSPVVDAGASTLAAIHFANSYVDVFNIAIDAQPIGLNLVAKSRVRMEGSTITNCTTAAVKAAGSGCEAAIYNQSPANTFTGNTKELILTGGATEPTLHTTAGAEQRVYHNDNASGGSGTLTGTTTATQMLNTGVLVPTASAPGGTMRVRLTGTAAGLGTKTIGLRLGTTQWLAVTSSTDYASDWIAEFFLDIRSLTSVLLRCRYTENASSKSARNLQTTSIDGTGNFRIYGTLSNAAGTLTLETVDVYLALPSS